jgi:predicted alpha/beta-fold hydrolase
MDAVIKCKKSILEFDNITRAKSFGFQSSNALHRAISCSHYLSYIDVPFLVMYSNDDLIVLDKDIPRIDLLSNKYCIYLESYFGGHCDFFNEK